MTEDGWLTTGRKLQLKIIFYGLLLGAATYTVIGLLNGFNYANHLIGEYPLPILNYIGFLIAAGPYYRKNDELIQQIAHQIGWSGGILLVPTVSSFIYYSFNPPTTGIGRITLTISEILVWITALMVLGAIGFTKTTSSKD